jgi:hypothetical protein
LNVISSCIPGIPCRGAPCGFPIVIDLKSAPPERIPARGIPTYRGVVGAPLAGALMVGILVGCRNLDTRKGYPYKPNIL